MGGGGGGARAGYAAPESAPDMCVQCVDFTSIYSVQDIWKIDKHCVWFVHKLIFM